MMDTDEAYLDDSEAFTLRRATIHGHEIRYRSAGNGPVLLMLHGMASSSDTWRYIVPALTGRFTIVAPDLLGHGATAKPRTEYSLGAQANMLRDLLALLGHERATVVGHSFGGGVAMQFAYQFPDRCERLVLVGSGGLGPEVNTLLRLLSIPGAEHVLALFCSDRLRDTGHRMAAWAARRGLRVSPVVEEIWRGYSSLADADGRSAFFRTLRAVIDSEGQSVSASDRLYLTCAVPTLIVWGNDDTIIPVTHAHTAHESIANSRLHLFGDTGHYPHCEAPERFTKVLIQFIDSTQPAQHAESDWNALLSTHRPSSDGLTTGANAGAAHHPTDRP
jgi:pimeloyl-ACP methyl ester carboxylesterase